MEQRKIQKVGQSTLSISLPKKWVNQIGLHSGDLVHIEHCGNGTLRLLCHKHLESAMKPREYYIDCNKVKEAKLFERLIVGCYVTGIEVITLFSGDRITRKQVEEIRNIVQRLIGISIIDATHNRIILQCFIDPSKWNISSLVQRLSIITSTMLTEAIEAFLGLNAELATATIQREDEANNIYWLITRLLLSSQRPPIITKKIELDSSISPTSLRLVSKNLERIADCSKGIAKIALHLHEQKDIIEIKKIHSLSPIDQLTKTIFQKAVNSLFSRDIIQANEALNLRDTLDTEVEAQIRTSIAPYDRVISIMLAMIAENSASIAAVATNLEITKSNAFPS